MPDKSTPEQARLLAAADSLFKARNYQDALITFRAAAAAAENAEDLSIQAESFSMIARCHLIAEDKAGGRIWLEKASKIANPQLPLGWSRFLGVRGRYEWQDKKLDLASATFKEMYDFCSANKLHERAIDAAHMVAMTSLPREQIEWGLKGIREAEAGNITSWLGPLWNNLGATYEDLKEYDKSLEAYLKAREYHYKFGDRKNRLVADYAVGHACKNLGEHDRALQFLTPLLTAFEELEDIEFQGLTAKEIGEIQLLKGDESTAHEYLNKALTLLAQAGMSEWDSAGYELLKSKVTALKAKGD